MSSTEMRFSMFQLLCFIPTSRSQMLTYPEDTMKKKAGTASPKPELRILNRANNKMNELEVCHHADALNTTLLLKKGAK